jgi:hypothetical protein
LITPSSSTNSTTNRLLSIPAWIATFLKTMALVQSDGNV